MADDLPTLQQTVDEFRSLASQLQTDSKVIDPQAIDFVTTVVDQSARLSREQRNFVFELGREAVINDSLTQFKERQVLLSELEGTLDDAQREHKSMLLDLTEAQIEQNNELLQNLQRQAVERGKLLGYGKDLSDEQSELLNINLQLAKLDILRSSMSDEAIEKAENHLTLRRKIVQSLKTEADHQQKLTAQQDAMGTLFGFNLEDIERRSLEIGDLFKTTLGRLTAAAIVLKAAVSSVANTMRTVNDAGFGIAQSWRLTRDYAFDFSGYIDRFADAGLITTMGDVSEAVAGIAGHYGDIADLTDENVAQSLILTRNLSMTAQEAGAFIQMFEKMPGYTEGMTEDFVTSARMLGEINQVSPEKIFSEMATHTSLFAKHGITGADAMARAVVSAAKMGVELSSIDAFADRVLDIDTFIQDVTKLRTLGINIEDPMRLAQLSQTGDQEGFIQELQSQLQGIGRELTVQDLGRTQLNSLLSAVGMNIEELQRIQRGADVNNVEALTAGEKADLERNQKLETTVGSLDKIFRNLNISNALLTAIAAATALNVGLPGTLGGFGKGALTRMAVGGIRGMGAIGGALAGGAGHLARGTVAAGRGAVNVGGRVAGGLGTAARGVGAAGGAVGRGASAVAGMGRGIPVIGAAAGMGIDLARGEKMGRAGSAAAGAATGAALGSIVPGIGTAIGAIAGGIIGRVAGQKIYDAVTDVDVEPNVLPVVAGDIAPRTDDVQRIDVETVDRPEVAPAPIMPGLNRQPTDEIDQTAIVSLATIVQQMQRDQEDRQEEEKKEIEIDLGGVEKRLDELTSMFETGKIAVVMDGRKVGRIMMNAYSRNVTA